MTPFYWRGRILLCRATDAILGWHKRCPSSGNIIAFSWPFHPAKAEARRFRASFTVTQTAESWLWRQAKGEASE
jgi:hypothetical protein